MKKTPKKAGPLLRSIQYVFVPRTAIHVAALAFSFFFTLAPLFFMAITILGLVVDVTQIQGVIMETVSSYTAPDIAMFVDSVLSQATTATVSIPAFFIGLFFMLFALYKVADQLFLIVRHFDSRYAKDTNVHILPKVAVIIFLFLLLGLFLTLASFTYNISKEFIFGAIPNLPYTGIIDWLDRIVFILFLFLFFFTLLRYVSPWKNPATKDLIPAAIISIGVYGLKYLLELYVAFGGISSVYGAASSIVIVLLWTQMLATIVLFGMRYSYELCDSCDS